MVAHDSVPSGSCKEPSWSCTAQAFEVVSALSGRIEITRSFSKYLKKINTGDALVRSLYLAVARVSPESAGDEFQVGENIILRALNRVTGISLPALKARSKKAGDISLAVDVAKTPKLSFARPRELLLSDVFRALQDISKYSGKDAVQQRVDKITEVLSRCKSQVEAKYFLRILDGKMKIGLSTQTILASLALAFLDTDGSQTPGKSAANWTEEETKAMETVKQAYSELPSFTKITEILQEKGLSGLSGDALVFPGHPLRPMLAVAEKSPEAVLARFKCPFTAEYKYDGERVQVHRSADCVDLFSRGLEKTTERFAEVVPFITQSYTGTQSYILDAEVVAYDVENGRILPFQVLSNRKRKAAVGRPEKEEASIALFLFDILYHGTPLTKHSLASRRDILRSCFVPVPGRVFFADHKDFSPSASIADLLSLFRTSRESGCEGLVVKSLGPESTYEPSRRSQKWTKLKADYITGVCDTLDLVVLGAYTGKGKRTGGHGGFLLGASGKEGPMQTVTKLGTGFSDSDLASLTEEMKVLVVDEPQAEVHASIAPDIWFRPSMVVEVAAASISLSPKYTAARGLPGLPEGKGLSLRFPRFVRKREDKSPGSATDSEQLLCMYLKQLDAS